MTAHLEQLGPELGLEPEGEPRVNDVEQAQIAAEKVQKVAGRKIDREWEKLKLAQAFGLEKIAESQRALIEKILNEAETVLESKRWEFVLTDLYKSAEAGFINSRLVECDLDFKYFIETRFGPLQLVDNDPKAQSKFPSSNILIFPGVSAGEYLVLPGTDHVLAFYPSSQGINKVNARLGQFQSLADQLRNKAKDEKAPQI